MSMKRSTRASGSKSSSGAQEPEVVIAPEGVEFSITTYVRSDSTNLEIVHVSDGPIFRIGTGGILVPRRFSPRPID
jgi:hypothetical protein